MVGLSFSLERYWLGWESYGEVEVRFIIESGIYWKAFFNFKKRFMAEYFKHTIIYHEGQQSTIILRNALWLYG